MRSEASSILPDDPRRVRWLSMRSGGAPGAGSWMLSSCWRTCTVRPSFAAVGVCQLLRVHSWPWMLENVHRAAVDAFAWMLPPPSMRSEASSILPDDPRRVRWLSMRSGGAPGAVAWMLENVHRAAVSCRLVCQVFRVRSRPCMRSPGVFHPEKEKAGFIPLLVPLFRVLFAPASSIAN